MGAVTERDEVGASSSEPASFVQRMARLPRRLYDWVIHWADTPHAVAALALLSFAESSFFPVPPDVLLIAMCLGAPQRALFFAAVCTTASVLGGALGYAIGALAWDAAAPWFFTYVPGFTEQAFERVRGLYNEYGVLIVFTAGFSPIPYKLFTIASGIMAQPLVPFVLASIAGRAGRFFLVAWLLRRFGPSVKLFIDRYFNVLALGFSVLLVGGFLVVKWVL